MSDYPGLWNLDSSPEYSDDTLEELEAKLAQHIKLSGKAGAGEVQHFRLHSGYLRCVDIIIQQRLDPRFQTRSDLYRYAIVFLLNYLKENEVENSDRFARQLESLKAEQEIAADIEQRKQQRDNLREWDQEIRRLQGDHDIIGQIIMRKSLVGIRNNADSEHYRDEITELINRLPS